MVCQRVIIIARGKIVAQGTPEELKQKAGGGIRVEVRGPADQVRQTLNALPGVDRVESEPSSGVGKFIVHGKQSVEMKERIALAISENKWALRELRQEGASLEEFFVRATAE